MNSGSMSKKKIESPCIDICKMDKNTGLCKGCLRTKEEIKNWKKITRSERRAIVETITIRRAQAKAA
jgi:predicted Fe-S protein YdhL (DUF1289 family)